MKELKQNNSIRLMDIRRQIFFILILLVFLSVGFKVMPFLRLPLGFLLLLFCPGYLFTLFLFPRKGDVDISERIAISFALSIVITLFVSLVFNYFPWQGHILSGMMSSVILIGILGWIRSSYLKKEEIFSIALRFKLPSFYKLGVFDKTLLSLLVFIWLVAGFTVYNGVVNPKSPERFTEFYLMNENTQQKGYISQMKSDQRVSVALGIVNREHRDFSYNIEIRDNELLVNKKGPIKLKHNQRWEEVISFPSGSSVGTKSKVEFLLYKDGMSDSYRSLHLWIDIL